MFPGSFIWILDAQFQGSTDKNLSIGENSWVKIESGRFIRGYYGIALKDGSHLELQNGYFKGNVIDIDLYIKKPYYPNPTLVTDGR